MDADLIAVFRRQAFAAEQDELRRANESILARYALEEFPRLGGAAFPAVSLCEALAIRAQFAAQNFGIEKALQAGADFGGAFGIDMQRAIAADFGEAGSVRGQHRDSTRHRLRDWKSEAFI